jgi:thiol-disulfide isomerase/thioredoxin
MRWNWAPKMGTTWVLLLMAGMATAQQTDVKVKGRVVDANGKPVVGADVASFWSAGEDDAPKESKGKQSPFGGAKTDGEGNFTVKVNFYGRDAALLAMDSDRTLGGTKVVPVAAAGRAVEIRVAPLVRVHGKIESKDLGRAVPWTNVYINLMPGKIRLLQNSSLKAEFSMLLPPGEYNMNAYGSDVKGINKPLALRAGESNLDLGVLDLPATMIARHVGKELPPWSLTDARGVKKDVTLADYRGKWVLVDFWGYWCGPCVRQLGELIDLYEDHAGERDKFEILAFHDGTVKDFSEMDAKTEQVKKSLWHGRSLPFPILLDAQNGARGATVAAYELQSFPTTILIDPQGKLVGEVSPEFLEKKLAPIPAAHRIPRALDRDVALAMNGGTLADNIKFLGQVSRISIKLDEPEMKAAGIAADAATSLTLSGSLSLRSWLELLLDSFALEAVPRGEGLVIVPAKGDRAARELSGSQKRCAARIEETLGHQVSFDFKNATLAQVAAHFEGTTQENFVLDPVGRKAGVIDPEATVTGSANDIPLRQALVELLKPLGLVPIVKDEVVVITRRPRP